MESELEPGSKTTGRIIIPVTRVSGSRMKRGPGKIVPTVDWIFQRRAKYRFCGIIFNEPRSHFSRTRRAKLTRFRARTVSTRFYPGKRPARSMVYHYGFACAAPWSFSSHLEQVPPLLLSAATATFLVTSCASVCVRARVHGPPNLLSFSLSFSSFFF